jgi:hypothetical protein
MGTDSPLYPNQQLRSVGLEACFRGHLSYPTRFGAVQDRFGERLGTLFVPTLVPGEAFGLRPYQLRSAAQKELLGIGLNRVIYVSFEYAGHDAFIGPALDLVGGALQLLSVPMLESVVYGYENEMIVRRDADGRIPIGGILKVVLPDGAAGDELTALDVSWTRQWQHGLVGTRVWVEDQEQWSLLRWSISATVVPAGAPEDLPAFASRAHAEARGRFEALITDEFREFLRQEREA